MLPLEPKGAQACLDGRRVPPTCMSVTPALSPPPVQDKTHSGTKNREDRSKPRRRPDRLPGLQVRGDLHDVRLLTGPDGNLPDDPVVAVDFQHDLLDAGARWLFSLENECGIKESISLGSLGVKGD